MGIYREKYTKTYFTGTNKDGSPAGYGVEGYNDYLSGGIRDIDLRILSRVAFEGKSVLEFGFGRGEAIKYAIEHGCARYEGVDFSPSALEIAKDFIARHSLPDPILHCADALEFLKICPKENCYDIVIMLDFVEHVPRNEFKELLTILGNHLTYKQVIVINTPCFKVDNDAVNEGLNESNLTELCNRIEETRGMHCNLYTVPSLAAFMTDCGYKPITEAHFYTYSQNDGVLTGKRSYRVRWEELLKTGFPIIGEYVDDVIEYAYVRTFTPEWYTFNKGDLKDISLLLNDGYLINYEDGFHDREMYEHLKRIEPSPKIIFDVGGFMGMSSLLFSKLLPNTENILCFEPNPWNYNRILANLSHNPEYAEKIALYDIAFGSENKEENMLLSESIDNGHSSTSQLLEGDGTNYSHKQLTEFGFHSQTVNVLKLDDFVSKTGIIPDIIKLDIEGAEALFLMGAYQTLQNHKPQLYIEFHSVMATLRSMRLLCTLGYQISVLKQEPDQRVFAFAKLVGDCSEKPLVNSEFLGFELEWLRINHEITLRKLDLMSDERIDLQGQLQSMQSQLADTQAQLVDSQAQLADTQAQLVNSQAQLAGTQVQLVDSQTQLADTQAQLVDCQARLAGTQDQLIDSQTRLIYTQAHLNNVLTSRSWKITKPARAIKRAFTKNIKST